MQVYLLQPYKNYMHKKKPYRVYYIIKQPIINLSRAS